MSVPASVAYKTLRLVLPENDEWATLRWIGWRDEHRPEEGMSPLAGLPAGEFIELLLPTRRVALHLLPLPPQAGRQLEALIGQALEDRLLGDKADALVMPGPQVGNERVVAVCSRRWLEEGLERLSAAGRSPNRLLPEPALLPARAEAVSCATLGRALVFRTPAHAFGLARDEETLTALCGNAPREPVTQLHRQPSPSGWPGALPAELARFAPRRFDPRSFYPALRWAAACAVLLILGEALHWRQLAQREARLQHEIRQTFATTFPGTPIVDPLLQWESKLRETGPAGHDALDAARHLAARLEVPLHPRLIEAGEGFVRLTLSESEVAQYKTALERVRPPETSPSELGAGWLRLHYRSTP